MIRGALACPRTNEYCSLTGLGPEDEDTPRRVAGEIPVKAKGPPVPLVSGEQATAAAVPGTRRPGGVTLNLWGGPFRKTGSEVG